MSGGKWVIELGERRKKADDTFEWIGHGFYNLYEPNGGAMIVVGRIEDAFHFDYKEHAQWVTAANNAVLHEGIARVVEHNQ